MADALSIGLKVIYDEISALLAIAGRLDSSFESAVGIIRNSNGRVVITGVGKSGIIGRKISSTMTSTGTASVFLHAADAHHGDLGLIAPNDVILAISNSGETEEVVSLIPSFKENGNKLISITGNKASSLAVNSDVILDARVQREACQNNLAPTSSTTAALVVGDALSITLSILSRFGRSDFARVHPGGSLGTVANR